MFNLHRDVRLNVHALVLIAILISSALVMPGSGAQAQAESQVSEAPVRRLRTIPTAQLGVPHVAGLVYSPAAQAFLVLGAASAGQRNAAFSLMTLVEEPAGVADVATPIASPLNMAFDNATNRLVVLDPQAQELVTIRTTANGSPDSSPGAIGRFNARAFGLSRAQGLTVDPASGRLWMLDPAGSRIVGLDPDGPAGFRGQATRVPLNRLLHGQPRGLAFNPTNGHLYVLSPRGQTLYELTDTGQVVATRDVGSLGLRDPQAMTFAPTGNTTDDPAALSLYVADSGAQVSNGTIVELALEALNISSTPADFAAALVQTIDTSQWSPPSPDPSGLAYDPMTQRLVVSDAEVEEMPIFQGKNVFDTTTAGNLSATCETIAPGDPLRFTSEPAGAAVNPVNGHRFFSDDNADRIYEVHLGADGIYCTLDDTVTSLDTRLFGSFDPEGLAFGEGKLIVAGGIDATVFVIDPGANGIFDGVPAATPPGDDVVSSFSTLTMGSPDLEGAEYNPDTGTLYLLSNITDAPVFETTLAGALVRVIDVSDAAAIAPAGLASGPGGQNAAVRHLYVADRRIDNTTNPNENDGKIYEVALGDVVMPDPIFADGFENGTFSAWSESRTTTGDLSVSPAAALVGGQGMQVTVNDEDLVFVADNRPAADVRYRARFYFDPNSVSMANGDAHFIFRGLDTDVNSIPLRVELRRNGANYEIRGGIQPDTTTAVNTLWYPISDGPHAIELDWAAASAPGANNGSLKFWLDNNNAAVPNETISGIDNDTMRVRFARLGAVNGMDLTTQGSYYFDAFESRRQSFIGLDPSVPVADPIFADGFESGDLSAWSSATTGGGDLSVSPAAALIGASGMQAQINDATAIFVTDELPNAETRYRARFYFDPNSLTMANGEAHFIFRGLQTATVIPVRIELRRNGANYEIRGGVQLDSGTASNTAWLALSDGPHAIELDWAAASAAGANNGSLKLWLDNNSEAAPNTTVSGVDNDTMRIESARLGAVNGLDPNTAGTYYFDAFESRRQSFIGPVGAPTPTNTPEPTATFTPSPTNTPEPTATFTPSPTNTPEPTATFTPSPTNTPTPDPIFSDGFETGSLLAWSASTTDGASLSVSAAAALAGSYGMQAQINDNNSIYVTDTLPAAERRYRARFYFDPNSLAMSKNNAFVLFQGYSGASTAVLRVELRFNGGYQLRASLLSDSGAWTSSQWLALSDAPHPIELDWQASTAVGANNGSLTLWRDGAQVAALVGADNDTWRVDGVRLGAVEGIDGGTRGTAFFDAFDSRRQSYIGPLAAPPTATPTATSLPTSTPTTAPVVDSIFADGFESGNLSAWSSSTTDGGNLSVGAAAALIGARGMQALINDNNSIYVTDTLPAAERRYRARFYFDPNSLNMGRNNAFILFQGYSGASTAVLRVELRFNGGYQLRASLLSDAAAWTNSQWLALSDAPHVVELDWRASTAAGANNGSLTLWLDGAQTAALVGADNDTWRVDGVRLGAVEGIDGGTRGSAFFDAFDSRRQNYIGP